MNAVAPGVGGGVEPVGGAGAVAGDRVRSVAMDVLKGLAMLGVLAQHAIPGATLHGLWDVLWIDQAVPVFLVLIAFNAAGSFRRSGARSLRELYSGAYLVSRLRRLVLPAVVVYAFIAVVAAMQGRLHLGPLVLLGAAPIDGGAPGDYFVGLVVGLALLLPAAWAAYLRAPRLTLAGLLAVGVLCELSARGLWYGSGAGVYLDVADPLRAAGAVAAGFWLAAAGGPRAVLANASARRTLIAGALVSLSYLVALQIDTVYGDGSAFDVLYPNFTRATGVFAVGWSLLIVIVGLVVLEPRGRAAKWVARPLSELGRASYHVFLVQAAVFGLWGVAGVGRSVLKAVAACVVGWGFWRLDARATGSAVRARLTGRAS